MSTWSYRTPESAEALDCLTSRTEPRPGAAARRRLARDRSRCPCPRRGELLRPLSAATERRAQLDRLVQLRRALRALCLTEIVSWGVLYYAFPVLSHSIAKDEGWSATTLTAVFSAALVIAAIAGVGVGRMIQHHGPRWVMTAGSVLGVGAVLAIGTAPTLPIYVAGWVLAGFAMSAVLYAPAFAAVTVWFGPDRVRALTAITLVAGLASTVFAPITAALDDAMGWRDTYLVLGIALGVLTVPTHLLALRPPWPDLPTAKPTTGRRTVTASPQFLLLAAGFAVATVGVYAAVINLVPLLQSRGFSTSEAALVLGVGGAGQVAGRLGYARLERSVGVRVRTLVVLAVCALMTGLLGLVPGPLPVLFAISLIAGGARGIFTLVQATAVSDRWGHEQYAHLNGVFTAPLMIASALAPFVGAALSDLLGTYQAGFVALAVLGLAAVLVLARERVPPKSH